MKKQRSLACTSAFFAVLAALVMAACEPYFPIEKLPPEPETLPPLAVRTLKSVTAVGGFNGEYLLTLEMDGEVKDLNKEDIALTAGGHGAADCLISKDGLTPAGAGKYNLIIGALVRDPAGEAAPPDVNGDVTVTLTARKGDVLLQGSQTVPVIFHGVSKAELINLTDVSAPVTVPGETGVYDLTLTFDQAVINITSAHISASTANTGCLLSKDDFSGAGDTRTLRITALAKGTAEIPAPVTVQAGGKVDDKWLLTGSSVQPQNVTFKPTPTPVYKYQGDLVITYVWGGTDTMKWDEAGGFILDRVKQNDSVIYKVKTKTTPEKEYLVGRKANSGALKLNLDADGELSLMEPVTINGVDWIPVGTIAELQMIDDSEENLGKKYLLDAELDLLGVDHYNGVDSAHKEWTPIGDDANPFTGEFDGAGKQISNLRITSGENIGLFGAVAQTGSSPARILNVKVQGDVSGSKNAGGIVGKAQGNVEIKNCESTVNVTADEDNAGGIAGLAGENGGAYTLIENCTTRPDITVQAQNNAGGIAGTGREIKNCRNYAKVEALENNAGGIAGTGFLRSSGGVYLHIENCGNYGQEVKARNNAGGIAGGLGSSSQSCDLDIAGCANSGDVTAGESNAGGIIGKVSAVAGSQSKITASYSRKHSATAGQDVNTIQAAANYAGGIVGRFEIGGSNPILFACYSTSKIVGSGSNKGAIWGGGQADVLSDCYFRFKPGDSDYFVTQSGSSNLYAFGDGNALSDSTPTGWPAANAIGQAGWGVGDGTSGNYWNTLGDPVYGLYVVNYPKLNWENIQ